MNTVEKTGLQLNLPPELSEGLTAFSEAHSLDKEEVIKQALDFFVDMKNKEREIQERKPGKIVKSRVVYEVETPESDDPGLLSVFAY